ncbi:MFS transporter [Streptomyces sp. MK7]|uniref:MFS transporter n=1 Tax=Streptomyces sp. MK7 TaxID=3067635 RepID=UPI00292F610C|nr:MFS transporter [Streptomyces sp. MK7]
MRSWMRVALAVFGVAWGANQFAPLLLVYREHLSEAVVTALFGSYAIGLIPALLVAASCSDRFGRRRVMRPVLLLSAAASMVLLAAGDSVAVLAAGRLLAGVASGAAFGPGSAWIKELSADGGPGAGARRAALALSAGFGGGPLVAGALAQWLPAPDVLPYVVHLLLMATIAPLAWFAPETVASPGKAPGARRIAWGATLRHPEFLRRVVPTAPLVFGAATVSFALLPSLVPVPSLGIAAGGGIAGLTLGSGAAVQPLARRLARRGSAGIRTVGLVTGTAGFALAAAAVDGKQPFLLPPAAVALGGCYGLLLVAGLSCVEALGAPEELAGVAAVFYCLTYLGLLLPYAVSAVAGAVPPAVSLLAAGAVTAVLIPVTAAGGGVPRTRAAPSSSIGPPSAALGTADDSSAQS